MCCLSDLCGTITTITHHLFVLYIGVSSLAYAGEDYCSIEGAQPCTTRV